MVRRRDRRVKNERMASLMKRITTFVKSPRGQQMIDQGQRELAQPENQRKLKQLAAKFTRRR
jgi:hypothetical protein